MSDYQIPYTERAGLTPRPADFQEKKLSLPVRLLAALRPAATSGVTFWSDVSEFQPVINSSYPYHVVAFRVDNGWRRDNHAYANWSFIHASSQIDLAIGYVVYIPGQLNAVLARVKALFGDTPPKKLALMIDMESGAGFAGPGNHSADANHWVDAFAAYLGSRKKVVAYANHSDFAYCWPGLPSDIKRVTASYGGPNPGTYGWQYFGGLTQYGSPSGWPRSCAPFGSWVDMDVFNHPLSAVLLDFGITTTVSPNPTPAPKPPAPAPKPIPAQYHRIVAGETLGGIAAKYKTSITALMKLNPSIHNPNLIYVGEVIKVSAGSAPSPTPPPTHAAKTHRIASGETLSGIAHRYGTTVSHLVAWNSSLIKNPNLIKVGWVIRVG